MADDETGRQWDRRSAICCLEGLDSEVERPENKRRVKGQPGDEPRELGFWAAKDARSFFFRCEVDGRGRRAGSRSTLRKLASEEGTREFIGEMLYNSKQKACKNMWRKKTYKRHLIRYYTTSLTWIRRKEVVYSNRIDTTKTK